MPAKIFIRGHCAPTLGLHFEELDSSRSTADEHALSVDRHVSRITIKSIGSHMRCIATNAVARCVPLARVAPVVTVVDRTAQYLERRFAANRERTRVW